MQDTVGEGGENPGPVWCVCRLGAPSFPRFLRKEWETLSDGFFGISLLTHIEQAEARQAVVNQQLLLHKLMFYLAQLHCAHAAA